MPEVGGNNPVRIDLRAKVTNSRAMQTQSHPSLAALGLHFKVRVSAADLVRATPFSYMVVVFPAPL